MLYLLSLCCCCTVFNCTAYSQAEIFPQFQQLYLFYFVDNRWSVPNLPYLNQCSTFYFISLDYDWLQPPVDGHLTDVVDDEWRTDQLPHDPIWVPTEKLPDPEADNGDSHLTLSEQVTTSYCHQNRSQTIPIVQFRRSNVGRTWHWPRWLPNSQSPIKSIFPHHKNLRAY